MEQGWLQTDRQAIGLLLFLTLLFFVPYLTHWNEFPDSYDLVRHRSYLLYVAYDTFQRFGQLPLWDPYTMAGYPYITNPHEMLFFPLSILFLFIHPDFLFIPFFILFTFLVGFCTYRFAKKLGLTGFSALVPAIIYMFSGTLVAKIRNGVFTYFLMLCLLPLLFLAMQHVLEKQDRKRVLFLAFVWALLLTVNYMQIFLYASFVMLLFVFLQLFFQKRWKHAKRIVLSVCLAGLFTIFLGAVMLLPLLEGASQSTIVQETDYSFATEASFHPSYFLHFLLPWMYGKPDIYFGPSSWGATYSYVGILTLFLALIGLLYAKNHYTKTFLCLGIFSLLFSLGKYTPFYLLFYQLPGFSLFRAPGKMMVIFVFSLALLAGFGVQVLQHKKWSQRQQQLWKNISLLFFLLCIFATSMLFVFKAAIMAEGTSMLTERYYEGEQLRTLDYYLPKVQEVYWQIFANALFLTLLSGLIAFLLNRHFQSQHSVKIFQAGVLALLVLDLFFFGMPLLKTAPREALFEHNPIADFLAQQDGLFRVLDTGRILPQDVAVRKGIQMVDGYSTSHLRHYTEFTNLAGNFPTTIRSRPVIIELDLDAVKHQTVLDLLNAKYVLSRKPIDNVDYRLVYQTGMHIRDLNIDATAYVYENLGVLPRAFVVHQAKIISEKEQLLRELGIFNPKEGVLLEEPLAAPLRSAGNFTEAEMVRYEPNTIEIKAFLDMPGFLVLSELWYPGWKAFDDGKEIPIYKADYALRAVFLEQGAHTITFIFRPASYRVGIWISFLTLLLFLILLIKK